MVDLTPPARIAPDTERSTLGADARVLALIPHFACHDWLEGTIESLLDQTRPVDGIVVIDDASPNPPVDIVGRFEQVTLLHAQENVGPYRLVQQVIDATNHDAIMFQDADDWSTPDRLERLLAAAQATGAELLGSDYMLVDTRRWAAQRILFPLDANAALQSHPTGHAQQHPSGLVARTLIDALGGYATGMRFSGDDEFLRRAAHIAKVVNVPRPLYYRRHRSESLTTSSSTGHGTPARRAVLAEMSERARANLDAVAAGHAPDLTPLRSRGPVELTHLSGPTLDQLNATSAEHSPTAGTRRDPGRVRRTTRLQPPAPAPAQVIVVGAPGSGHDALACALAQHPAFALAGDITWAAQFGTSLDAALAVPGHDKTMVPVTRPGTQLDTLAADAGTLAALIGPALDTVIIGGGPAPRAGGNDDSTELHHITRLPLTGDRRWVGTAPADRAILAALDTVFPDAQFVHVVRDVDEVAGIGGGDGTTDPAQAARDWSASVDVLLDLEAAIAPRITRFRLQDATTNPAAALGDLLEALGEDYDPAVARLFTPPEPAADSDRHPAVSADARRLSAALLGPVRHGGDRDRLTGPTATQAAAPAATAPAPDGPVRKTREQRTSTRASGPAAPMRRQHPRTHPSVPSAVALVDSYTDSADTVAVISRGDDALLRFRATGLHLPATPDGHYAGHHPANDRDAIEHLEAARANGTRHLLVPSTADWWFEHYRGFSEHLARTATRVAERDGHVLFRLDSTPADGRPSLAASTAAPTTGPATGTSNGTSSGPVSHAGRDTGNGSRRSERRADHSGPGAQGTTNAAQHRSPSAARAGPGGARPKVHVISWSVSHNPYGRAHLLADVLAGTCDVELVGATFDRFGGGIWQPLADQHLPLRTFRGGTLPEMLPAMEDMARTLTGDAIVVSKPRFPGLGLALMAKLDRDIGVVVDIDDHELAFVNATAPMTLSDLRALDGNDALLNPFGGPWTRYCDHLVGAADATTVSNAALQALFGGDVIGHARNEQIFDPALWDRDAIRSAFGFAATDRVVLFGGTPRRHKGIVDMAAALRRIGDPRLKLCLIETAELAELADDLAEYSDLIRTVGYQAMRDLPALVTAADLMCVLQDPTSPVARYQIPAKITDALAMGTPCLATPVPPLAQLTSTGALNIVDGPLDDAIRSIFDNYDAALERAALGRQVFLDQLSYRAVRPKLTEIIHTQIATPSPAPAEFADALTFARSVGAGRDVTAAIHAPAIPAADSPVRCAPEQLPSRPAPTGDRHATSRAPGTYDVVMFWKQNDTGVYGRRHDMLLDQFARSPRINRIVQFDHPIGITNLDRLAQEPATSHGRLVHDQTVARLTGRADDTDGKVLRRVFVYENRAKDDPARIEGQYPARSGHTAFVQDVLDQAGIGADGTPTVLVGYPKHFDLPDLIDVIEPDLVVADVVDDHRTWRRDGVETDDISRHYADVLGRCDLVLTNCAPMTAEMEPLASNVHLVPNGCEWPPPPVQGPAPAELAALDGPIIGYVGNLSSRIDIDLLDLVARTHPEWNLVLVGSTHAGRDVLELDVHDNVHFLGPRCADDARRFIDSFDVAIIPHVDDPMTRKMHPLKAFVYCSVGVPVVSTAIDNLDELADLVRIADTSEGFIDHIAAALAEGRTPMSEQARATLAEHAWTARMADIERLLDRAWERRGATEVPATSTPGIGRHVTLEQR